MSILLHAHYALDNDLSGAGNALPHLSSQNRGNHNLTTIVAVGFFSHATALYRSSDICCGWLVAISLTERSDPAMNDLWRHYEIAVLTVVLSFIIQ